MFVTTSVRHARAYLVGNLRVINSHSEKRKFDGSFFISSDVVFQGEGPMSYQNVVLSATPPSTRGHDTDQRYWPRWEVTKQVVCLLRDTGCNVECRSKNLSCDGICLLANQDLSSGNDLLLTVFLEEDTSFQIEGRVVWHQVADHYHKHGIVFHKVSPETQELLCEYAFTITPLDLLFRLS
jgi:hypothetical protein